MPEFVNFELIRDTDVYEPHIGSRGSDNSRNGIRGVSWSYAKLSFHRMGLETFNVREVC